MGIRIIDSDDLPTGGFAGIVETKLVMSPSVWPEAKESKTISHGLGDFIYLANGHFKPNDGVPIHPHNDVDIVSIITSGEVGHEGTLGDGTVIKGPGVQVQRAGTGMRHSEFNIISDISKIIQVWFKPPQVGLSPNYKNFTLTEGKMTTVLGGESADTFTSNMICQVGFISDGETLEVNEPFIVFVFRGSALANQSSVREGVLIEGEQITLTDSNQLGIVLIVRGNSA